MCVCVWVCYHDNSKLRTSILTKLGLYVKGSNHLQLIKFWPSRAPGKRVCGGAKFLAPPCSQRAVFVSPPSAFFLSVFLRVFFALYVFSHDCCRATLCRRPVSVCPSVRHTPVLYPYGSSYRQNYFLGQIAQSF